MGDMFSNPHPRPLPIPQPLGVPYFLEHCRFGDIPDGSIPEEPHLTLRKSSTSGCHKTLRKQIFGTDNGTDGNLTYLPSVQPTQIVRLRYSAARYTIVIQSEARREEALAIKQLLLTLIFIWLEALRLD